MLFGLGKHATKTIAEVWKASVSMVSSNKILTVSYGTFSCTLEGFDNSFDTMKAIAEYFRDLAQDDRYFGAEPPTPDAEMLARIAEREIERRVEARFEKGNLVLRPTDEAGPPRGDVAPEQSSDAASVGATAGVAATALAVANTPKQSAFAAADPQVEEAEEALDDSGSLTLNDIQVPERPDVATISEVEMADVIADDEFREDEDVSIDLTDIDLSDLSLESVEQYAIDANDILNLEEDTSEESSIDDLISAHGARSNRLADVAAKDMAPTEIEDVAPSAAPVVDSVADKLQRIRAVVAAKSQAAPEYIEDEHAMSGPDGDGDNENDVIDADAEIPGFVDATDARAETDVAMDDASDEDDNLFADTIAAVVNDQIDMDEDEFEEDAVLSDASFDDDDEDEDDTAVDSAATDAQRELEALRAKIAALEARAASAQAAASDVTDDEDDEVYAEDDDEPLVLEGAAEIDDDIAEDARAPIVARVSKAKRSDVEAALAAGEIEEYDEEDEDDDIASAPVPSLEDSSLTREQEEELARELAALHAEIEEDDDWNFDDDDDDDSAEDDDAPILSEADEEEATANIRKAVKLTSPGRAMLTDTSIEEDDHSVDRLADKTDTEMDEPEGNRRRSAIAHLRAAVAATKADRLLGFGKKTVDEEVPYREDLADAVRPRRPKVTEARSERPAPVRPAPLKLVAEQRIDVEDLAPVRPRRVLRSTEAAAETADASAGDDTGFADFAESQGAHTLPELLEAAAAYMSFVEGRDQFSRPQLMTKLLQAEGEASSREERLRSFGQLLREGKIQKMGGGRFAAADTIGFKPNARAAG